MHGNRIIPLSSHNHRLAFQPPVNMNDRKMATQLDNLPTEVGYTWMPTVLMPGKLRSRPKIGTRRKKFIATGKKPLYGRKWWVFLVFVEYRVKMYFWKNCQKLQFLTKKMLLKYAHIHKRFVAEHKCIILKLTWTTGRIHRIQRAYQSLAIPTIR